VSCPRQGVFNERRTDASPDVDRGYVGRAGHHTQNSPPVVARQNGQTAYVVPCLSNLQIAFIVIVIDISWLRRSGQRRRPVTTGLYRSS
jgi:hypothetical protein